MRSVKQLMFSRSLLGLATAVLALNVQAGFLSGGLNVDNAHQTYLSTDNNAAGTLLVTGANWGITDTFSGTELLDGQDYYLHISAQDHGGIAGLIGSFSIAGDSHVFANGLSSIDTNATDWLVSTVGWADYTSATFLANNGEGPWGYRSGVNAAADWIWSADAMNHNQVYFSLEISAAADAQAVPEPASLALFALGLFGLNRARKRFASE